MTLSYRPGDSPAHRFDPRSKLAFQIAFAVAAFEHTTPRGLLVLTAVVAVALAASGLSAREALAEYKLVFPFLVAGPLLSTVTLGPPWVRPAEAIEPVLASYRVLLVLLVSSAYLRTTPVRESRAAIQHLVPGKPGQLLGLGVGFVFRFFPVLLADARRVREASKARLGDRRSLVDRMRLVGVGAIAKAFERADRFALALRARCFSWNPTLPPLSLSRADLPVLSASAALVAWAVV